MKVTSCEKLTIGDLVQFEVALKRGKKSIEIVYDANGKPVNKK